MNNESAGYKKDDLVVASIPLRDEKDGDAVCADVCCDQDGYYVYALMISREKKGAWIKVFKHHNRTFEETSLRYTIPYDTSPLQFVMRTDVRDTIVDIPLRGHIGLPVIYQKLCYGAGIEYYNGFLYIITRRVLPVELVTIAGYDVVLSPPPVLADDVPQRYPIRLYEKRVGEVQFNLLTIINASSGSCCGHHYLSRPETERSAQKTDAVFQGVTWIDDKLITQVRYDHNSISSNVKLWHLQESKISFPDRLQYGDLDPTTGILVTPSILAILPVLEGKVPDPLPPVLDPVVQAKLNRVIDRIKYIRNNPFNGMPTPITTIRGQTALVSFNSPLYTSGFIAPVYPLTPPLYTESDNLLPFTTIHNRFPWGIVMAYSLSADSAERKLYGVYGNQLWVFDMMEYTFLVRYPNDDGTATFFEGDIIDLGDVTLYNRHEIQCWLRNLSDTATMEDVHLIINLTVTDDFRAKDVFLAYSQGTFGYKDIALGDIPPGGSKEFWVEIHLQDIKEEERHTSHRVPVQVLYKTSC